MYLFITILIMEILVGAEIDLFVPSFPEIQTIFNISTFEVELLLGINFIGHCITSLIVGNLGDRFGRKAIIIIGLMIFVIGSMFCAVATHYYALLLGRLLQGIGIAGIAVLGYVVIADIYSAERQQMLGILNGAITLGMDFAPVIGSYVSFLLGWRGNFSILLALGLICLVWEYYSFLKGK